MPVAYALPSGEIEIAKSKARVPHGAVGLLSARNRADLETRLAARACPARIGRRWRVPGTQDTRDADTALDNAKDWARWASGGPVFCMVQADDR